MLTWYKALYPSLNVGRRVEIGKGVRFEIRRNGKIEIGDDVFIGPYCCLESAGLLQVGANSFIGQGSVIAAQESVTIADDALIAERVTIRDQDHGIDCVPYRKNDMVAVPLKIGANVWIGAGAVILKGVRLGDDTIVGANAVVTKSFPPSSKIVGVPAHETKPVHCRRS